MLLDISFNRKRATAITGSLGFPSKMPGTSYGIPAQACHVGAKLAEIPGSVCHDCYALTGRYAYPNVMEALNNRLNSITHPDWVKAMVSLLLDTHAKGSGKRGPIANGWHRWHDSGDIQNADHLAKICEVAKQTPHIKHWLPTREIGIVKQYFASNPKPSNLMVRVSATMVDGPATKVWEHTSTVHTKSAPKGAWECPAPKQGNACGDCRACWNPKVKSVSYHKH